MLLKKAELISIIIPTYNRATLLYRSVNSVINQIYPNWELIIIDDASKDNTESVVESFQDKRIKYVKLNKNKGVSNARNIGLEIAKGEFLAFLDSDDEWLPEKLVKQLEVFKNTSLNSLVVVSSGYFIKGKDNNRFYTPNRRGYVLEDFVFGRIKDYQPQCWLIKTNYVQTNNIRFDVLMHSGEDWDFMARLLKAGQLDYVPEILVHIYQDKDERLWSYKRHQEALTLQINKYKNDTAFSPGMLAHLHISKANFHFRLGETTPAVDAIKKAGELQFNLETSIWRWVGFLASRKLNHNKLFSLSLKYARKYSFH